MAPRHSLLCITGSQPQACLLGLWESTRVKLISMVMLVGD